MKDSSPVQFFIFLCCVVAGLVVLSMIHGWVEDNINHNKKLPNHPSFNEFKAISTSLYKFLKTNHLL